jgi:hypothetical protein
VCLLIVCAWSALVASPRAQDREDDAREEVFERIDPYTRAEPKALDRAGYISLGPFPLAEGIKTGDVEETIGAGRVLWVETAHFKLGSTLRTYKLRGDIREEKTLKLELERLSKRLEKPATLSQGRLDPWLRLHLYAQRLEDQYADFCTRFGIKDADFAPSRSGNGASANAAEGEPGYMGEGPFLGQEMKLSVLITEKSSSQARFTSRWIKRPGTDTIRDCLPGGSMFFGTAAQTWKDYGYDLDATLRCVVADGLAHNFVEGFRKSWGAVPVWFRKGLAYAYARDADPRFPLYAKGALRKVDDDSWIWEPRLHGIVQNQIALSWKDMMAWRSRDDIKPQDHMVAWSRVSWLTLTMKPASLHEFLMGVTDSTLAVPEEDRAKVCLEKQTKAIATAFGKSAEELDQAWRKYVLKTYPKK